MAEAEVYVGKDVDITLQIPVEKEVLGVGDGIETEFTVDHTPISDRDMDGAVDDVDDIDVYLDGVKQSTGYTVVSSTGAITFGVAPGDGVVVSASYRYDGAPYVAQEFTVEPSAEVRGVDGLGTDEVQIWARVKRSFGGSIREVFHSRSQLERTRNFYPSFMDAGGSNLVQNPDVETEGETGKPAHWASEWGEWSTAKSHSPTHSLRIQSETAGNVDWKNDAILVKPDCQYRLQAWAIGTVTTGKVVVEIKWYSDAAGEVWIDEDDLNIFTRGQWHILEGFFKAPHNAASCRVVFQCVESICDVYADDFEILEGAIYGKDHGIIAKWDDGTHVVKVGFDEVRFGASVSSPKGEEIYVETPWQAKTGKTM